jgi:hypothetical protein
MDQTKKLQLTPKQMQRLWDQAGTAMMKGRKKPLRTPRTSRETKTTRPHLELDFDWKKIVEAHPSLQPVTPMKEYAMMEWTKAHLKRPTPYRVDPETGLPEDHPSLRPLNPPRTPSSS